MSAILVDPTRPRSEHFPLPVPSVKLIISPRNTDSAKRNLFGGPKSGEVSELYRREEKRRLEEVEKKFEFTKSENNLSPPANDDAEESLIEKEEREYNEKINQPNLLKSFILKYSLLREEYCRKIGNSSCRAERVEPYSKHQASVTDYFGQRRRASRNNVNILTPSEENFAKEIDEMLANKIPNQTMPDQGLVERVGNDSNSNLNSNTNIITNNTEPNISASNNTTTTTVVGISNEVTEFPTPPRDHQQSQEEISLHTMK